MRTWQPIETAPKIPNEDILVYRPNCKPSAYIPQVGVDYWSPRLGNVWAKSNHYTQPTHWMPLPEPPK
jgi:hypothetical protein